ncbi:MAG: hypothetical protein KAR21_23235, partial [Spirochaetales bacterium]|nr:hypothetical protein [Spirochaetales bacterium]
EGIDFFIRNKKRPHRFRMADNVVEYGFPLTTFTPAHLQRMILMDYISMIEVSRIEFNSRRNEIIDITKLIVYGMLYKKFDDHIYKIIIKSRFIENWNCFHPDRIIDEKSRINWNGINVILARKEKEVEECFDIIMASVEEEIEEDESLSAEDKKMSLHTASLFLKHLKEIIWYILICSKRMEEWEGMICGIKDELLSYLGKTRIAEYLSLVVMELSSYAETANLKDYVRKTYRKKRYIDNILYNAELRDKILQRLAGKNEFLFLTWKIRSRHGYTGNECRLQTILFNKAYEYQKIKIEIEDRNRIDLKGKTLYDFYSKTPEDERNNQLGLFYLSYLNEACNKQNIHFDSFVNHALQNDLTVINMSLNFK